MIDVAIGGITAHASGEMGIWALAMISVVAVIVIGNRNNNRDY